MGQVINLRQQRKLRKREADAEQADQNRIAHGLSKAARNAAKTAKQDSEKKLRGKLLDPNS